MVRRIPALITWALIAVWIDLGVGGAVNACSTRSVRSPDECPLPALSPWDLLLGGPVPLLVTIALGWIVILALTTRGIRSSRR